jgi:hypothetical protein
MHWLARLSVLAVLPLAACVVREERPHPREPQTTAARDSGAHPAYLHALSDLRNARANLERKGGDAAMRWDEHVAVEHIDRAIAEIKRAAIDDGKPLDDHPPVDAKEPRSGRLHKALAALRQARADIEHEEDTPNARGLRNHAIEAIDAAIRETDQGITEAARTS